MMATTTFRILAPLRNSISNKEPFFVGGHRIALNSCVLPHHLPLRSAGLSCSSRRRGSSNPAVTSKKNNKNKTDKKNVGDDEIDEDAIDAHFSQLEEDLKNDELFGNGDGDGDDDLSEEDLAKLEQELAEALEDDELFGALNSVFGDTKSEDGDGDGDGDGDEDEDEEDSDDVDGDGPEVDDEEEEEESPIKLRSWQARRLAYALKKGRRKTSIKNLAADLCLDRAVVLKLLRDPPPSLVMMSATLPDKPEPKVLDPVERRVEQPLPEETPPAAKPEVKVNVPVHVMQSNWSARKRLKKVQVETLEQVYKRTKRPTNAIVSSIVHVTNLPRRRVVKWFEEKRAEEGVPDKRLPYQRPASESVFTS